MTTARLLMSPEREPRSFYGGEVPTGPASTGEIGRAPYEGPGLGAIGVWKCPQCRKDNEGDPAAGCVHCGSGSARPRHVGVPPIKPSTPIKPAADPEPSRPAVETTGAGAESMAIAWFREHPHANLLEAFEAGFAAGRALGQMEPQPPAAAPVEVAFSPTAKVQRTIVAALRLFRDQLEPSAPEITDGEWCSHDEIDHLIHQFEEEPHV